MGVFHAKFHPSKVGSLPLILKEKQTWSPGMVSDPGCVQKEFVLILCALLVSNGNLQVRMFICVLGLELEDIQSGKQVPEHLKRTTQASILSHSYPFLWAFALFPESLRISDSLPGTSQSVSKSNHEVQATSALWPLQTLCFSLWFAVQTRISLLWANLSGAHVHTQRIIEGYFAF